MQPNQDYKQLLTDVIKKQIVILGPDITLSKARNVHGITVADDGTVTNVEGSAQEVTQALIDQFVQLSGLIVKKTMEPLLNMQQGAPTPTPIQPMPIATQVSTVISSETRNLQTDEISHSARDDKNTTSPVQSVSQIDPQVQAVIDSAVSQSGTMQSPTSPTSPTTQPQTPPTPQQNVQPATSQEGAGLAKNPLAA